MNAEDASELQTIKTLDSIETRLERMRVTIQEFYTSSGLEQLYKSILDIITNVVNAMNKMPKAFGKIPAVALTLGMQTINVIKLVLAKIIADIQASLSKVKLASIQNIRETGAQTAKEEYERGKNDVEQYVKGRQDGLTRNQHTDAQKRQKIKTISSAVGMYTTLAGSAVTAFGANTYGASMTAEQDKIAGGLTLAGTGLSVVGNLLQGNKIGAIIAGITGLVAAIKQLNGGLERELELANKRIEAAHQQTVLRKGEVNELATSLEKLKQLEEAQYSSNEAMQEYINYRNQLAEQFPTLVSGYDGEYNAIISLSDGYTLLAQQIKIATKAEEEERFEKLKQAKLFSEQAQLYSTVQKNSFEDATRARDIKTSLNGDNIYTYKQKALDLYSSMNVAGAFSGLYDDKFNAKNIKHIYESAKTEEQYKRAYENLISLNNTINSYAEEYAKLLEKNANLAHKQSLAYDAIINSFKDDKLISQFNSDSIFQGIINTLTNYTQSFFTSDNTIAVFDKNGKIIEQSLEEYFGNFSNQWYDFYNNLIDDKQKEVLNIISNRDLYSTGEEWKKAFIKTIGSFSDTLSEDFYQSQLKAFEDNQIEMRERLSAIIDKNAILQNRGFKNLKDGIDSELSSATIKKVITDLDHFITIYNNGLKSYSNNLIEKYDNLTTSLSLLNEETKIEVESLFYQIDFFDKTAVKKFIDKLKTNQQYKNDDKIQSFINELQSYADTLQISLNTMINNYVSGISDAQSKLKKLSQASTKGFDEIKDMQEIFNLLESLNLDLDWGTAFEQFNGTWVLTVEAYNKANQALWDKLNEDQIDIQKRINEYKILSDHIRKKSIGNAINLSTEWASLLDINENDPIYNDIKTAIDSGIINIKDNYDAFLASVKNWLNTNITTLEAEFETVEKIAQSIYVNQAASQVDIIGFLQSSRSEKARLDLQHSIDNYKAAVVESGSELSSVIQDNFIDIISEGGQDAVNIVQAFYSDTGRGELSASDIETIYRAKVSKLMDAFDQLTYGPGSIIDETAAKLIEFGGGKTTEIANGQYKVIQSATNLFDAYTKLYADLFNSGNATVSDLNKVAAAAFENNNNETAIVQALGDAADMTYTRFGEILTGQGKLFADYINKTYVQHIGGGKIRITDFTAFAADMGWNSSSEEYISAFKSYNDALIELNNKTERNIVEEVQKIENARTGDKVNLTQLSAALQDDILTYLSDSLVSMGGYLKDGILTLDKDADILGITKTIIETTQSAGILLQNDILELNDSLHSLFKTYIELISGGIAGSLTGTQASNLQDFAKNTLNISNINFTQTANGLKISQDAAIEIYSRLKEIDTLQASLVFKDIADSFQQAGEECENISSTLAEIAKIEAQLPNTSGKENQVLRDRLALYKEIANSQMSDPNQFKFMDRNLPSGMQGPENYWNAVGKAYTAMNSAKSSGYMEIQDYYNIVNEMANLMEMSGGKLEWMGMNFENAAEMSAKLIEQGMSALTNIDGKGVKISMAKLGADFGIGVDDMSKGFDEGIKEMARAQIKMLDAQIQLLEGIVALEALGNIDVDKSGTIDLTEVFDGDKFTEGYKEFQKGLQDNEKLKPLLEQWSIDGHTLMELFNMSEEELRAAGISKDRWVDAVNALYQISISDDYDLEHIPQSLRDIMATLGTGQWQFDNDTNTGWLFDFSGRQYTVTWDSNKEKQKLVDAFKKAGVNKTFEEASEIIKKGGQTGEFSSANERLAYELYFGNVDVTVDKSGKKTYKVKGSNETYENENDVLNALVGLDQKNRGAVSVDDNGKKYQLEAGLTYTAEVTAEGKTVYKVEGIDGEFTSYQDMINAVLQKETKDKYGEGKKFSDLSAEEQIEIKRKAKVLVTPSVELADSENGLTADQKANLTSILGKTEEEIQKLLEGKDAEVTYGIKLNPDSTGGFSKDELLALASANGIETKYLNIVATIISEDEEIIKLLESEPATKDIVLNVTDVNYGPLSGDPNNPNSSLKLDVNNATSSLENLKQLVADITNVDWSNYNTLDELLADVVEKVEKIKTAVETFANQTFTVELNQTGTGTVNIDSTTDTSSIFDLVSSLDSAAQSVIKNIQEVIEALQGMSGTADALDKLGDALVKITDTQSKIATISSTLSTFSTKIDNIRRALGKIPTGTKSLAVKFSYSTSKSSSSSTATSVQTKTSGGSGGRDIQTKAVAVKGNQPAFAAGTPTLMGELGPELVVSNGHYFVVGQGGAEFVNLAKDAIVFNHRQTKKLLQNGSIGSRGIPFTNETNALSFAKGGLFGPALKAPTSNTGTNTNTTKTTVITKTSTESITGFNVSPLSHTLQLLSFAKGNAGPAMASASAALAQLKQIRAMWQSMLDASAKELGSLAGAGGGKKGGGGGKDWQEKTTTAEIQRWYNLIRQIAKLEEDITYQETLQSKLESDRVTNGKAMYKSYKQELAFLQQEIEANQELAALQKSWYDNKRAELAASDYGRIFTYDENGLQQYVGSGAPGSGLGLDILENLTRRDVYGQAMDNAATARQQLEYLRSVGFNTENLRFNDDGTFIDISSLEGEELDNAYVQMMENFWDKVDGWRDELDSIYDSYHEQLEKVLSNEDKQNQILQKIVDNQLAVEQAVLNSIESREQKRIDDAKDERDALADSTDKFLNGLSDQLNKEREMYQKQSEQDDLNKLRRQLAILMRSGGASSQIRSLQDQINAKSQDAYFDAQQEQIDTLKQASDAQLERLDTQIDLMTETLEYQKENGLLWQEVYEVMAQTPSQIQDFIMNNTPDFQSNSALQVAEDLRELKLQIEEWTEYRDDVAAGNSPMDSIGTNWDTYYNSIKPLYGNVDASTMQKAREAYNSTLATTGDPNAAASAAMSQLQQYQKVTPTPNVSSGSYSLLNGGGVGGAVSEAEKVSNVVGLLKEGNKGNDVVILQKALNALGYTDNNGTALDVDGIFGSKTKQAVRKFQTAMGISSDGIVGDETKEKFRMKGYIKGGIVDYTGLAAVHGSAAEPESFFNAANTKLLMQDMELREQLLPSLLDTYNKMLQNNTNRNILENGGETLNIERLELNMQIQQMNNDYDARRAARTFKDELLNISRKSGNMSLSRG